MGLNSTNGTQRWSLPREISRFPFRGAKDIKHEQQQQQKTPEHHKNCPVPTNRKTKGLNGSKALHNSEQHFYFQCRQQIPFRAFCSWLEALLWNLFLHQIIRARNLNRYVKLCKVVPFALSFFPTMISNCLRVSVLNPESLVDSFLNLVFPEIAMKVLTVD